MKNPHATKKASLPKNRIAAFCRFSRRRCRLIIMAIHPITTSSALRTMAFVVPTIRTWRLRVNAKVASSHLGSIGIRVCALTDK